MIKPEKPSGRVRVGVVQPVGPEGPTGSETNRAKIVDMMAANVAHICELVQQAAGQGIDIVCLPEDVSCLAPMAAHGEDEACFRQAVNDTAGPTMSRLQETAKSSGVYIVGANCMPEGDKVFNTAFLIGADGEVRGLYRKTHLPPGETRFMVEGTEYPVFDTPLGRIGMVICWDLMFPETTRMLALNGAELIFCPTLGFDFGGEHMGEMRLRVRAFDNAVHMATATYASAKGDGTGRSCIVGPQGEFLADTGHQPDRISWADLDPTDRSPDSTDPEGKHGLNMWGRWAASRRPHTYDKMIEALDG